MLTFGRPVNRRLPPGAHLAGGRASAVVNRDLAERFYAPLVPVVAGLRRAGLSLRAIARELERRGFRTRQGGRWHARQVQRILSRARGVGVPVDLAT